MRGGTDSGTVRVPGSKFQSTRPLRGGTGGLLRESVARGISIHPPLAGRDLIRRSNCLEHFYFNPPALAGRDRAGVGRAPLRLISIHPPLRGGTVPRNAWYNTIRFQSTRPCGAGPASVALGLSALYFNPPAPCGAGRRASTPSARKRNFNPPVPCGAGLNNDTIPERQENFNPPAPCGAGLP